MPVGLVVACAVVGLVVGSYLTVLIERVPKRISVVRPVSRCPSCEQPLSVGDLIPVLSWIRAQGRCRYCGERTGLRYPLVELGTAALFAVTAARIGADPALPGYLLFVAALVAISVIDLDHFIIPNRIVYPTLFASVPLLTFAAVVDGDGAALARAAIGGLLAWLGLLVIHLISPRGMGFGDVRLASVIGVYAGWISYTHVLLAIFLGFFVAAIVGILLLLTRRRGRKDPVPFGPFLAIGAIVAVLAGDEILDWWLAQ